MRFSFLSLIHLSIFASIVSFTNEVPEDKIIKEGAKNPKMINPLNKALGVFNFDPKQARDILTISEDLRLLANTRKIRRDYKTPTENLLRELFPNDNNKVTRLLAELKKLQENYNGIDFNINLDDARGVEANTKKAFLQFEFDIESLIFSLHTTNEAIAIFEKKVRQRRDQERQQQRLRKKPGQHQAGQEGFA